MRTARWMAENVGHLSAHSRVHREALKTLSRLLKIGRTPSAFA